MIRDSGASFERVSSNFDMRSTVSDNVFASSCACSLASPTRSWRTTVHG